MNNSKDRFSSYVNIFFKVSIPFPTSSSIQNLLETLNGQRTNFSFTNSELSSQVSKSIKGFSRPIQQHSSRLFADLNQLNIAWNWRFVRLELAINRGLWETFFLFLRRIWHRKKIKGSNLIFLHLSQQSSL